jgi:hypothetical protein
MKRLIHIALAAFVYTAGSFAFAGDFDGSRQLICATTDALECTSGEACSKEPPKKIGAPAFMRVDFAKKQIVGKQHTSAIRFMDNSGESLKMQGTELGYAWTIALSRANGDMSVTLVDSSVVFVLFGSCTPL